MKKILFSLFAFFLVFSAQSAQVVNVEYIHNAIQNKWDITIPYNPNLTDPQVVANMKYLLTTIDVANQNLGTTTNYGTSEYATLVVADTVAADTAIDTLIKRSDTGGDDDDDPTGYKFSITHNYDTYVNDYTAASNPEKIFRISAAGTFYVDWGDGTEEVIERNNTIETWYGHRYASDGVYTIRLGGKATDYSDDEHTAAIRFTGALEYDYFAEANFFAVGISGCLGCVFPTLPDGSQPRFTETFANTAHNNNVLNLPAELFNGIKGAPTSYMFEYTFSSALIHSVPAGLFSGIRGAPAPGMFSGTFSLTQIQEIPSGLFAGIQGPPAANMFDGTFMDCGMLKTIPAGLFAGISGAPADGMFVGTFAWCYELTNIPDNLFAGISGAPANMMFAHTFSYCSNLTGNSAKTNQGFLYNIWPNATSSQVGGMYSGCNGLSDYGSIPSAWK